MSEQSEDSAPLFDSTPMARILGSDVRATIYTCVHYSAPVTSRQIADRTGIFPSTVREQLPILCEDGLLHRWKMHNGEPGAPEYLYATTPIHNFVRQSYDLLEEALVELENTDGGKYGN